MSDIQSATCLFQHFFTYVLFFRDENSRINRTEGTKIFAKQFSIDGRFRSVEKNAVKVINTVTQSQLAFCDEEKEVFDVCKAIDDMRTEARAEGRAEGKNEGRTEGMLEQARKTAYNLHDMGLPTDKIAGAVNVSTETVREWFVRRPGQIAT